MMFPKIAFVEWDTKVPIWQYEGTPSYACDPRVIDPTAFGANATAVKGCLVGVRPFETTNRLEELVDFLNSRDCVFFAIRSFWDKMLDVMRRVKTKKMLGFAMGLDHFRETRQHEGQYENLVNIIREVDMVTSFSRRHCHYLNTFTNTPVKYLPMAYPYSYVRKNFRVPPRYGKKILLPGVVWSGDSYGRRDDIGSCAIAHRLARNDEEVTITLLDRKMHSSVTHSGAFPMEELDRDFGTNVMKRTTVLPGMGWHEFLKLVQSHDFAIHWDWCWSTGRQAADMAALGIPYLGGNSDHAEMLFPDLSVANKDMGEFDIDVAVQTVKRVFWNTVLRSDIIDRADEWGSNLDYDLWSKSFLRYHEEIA